MFVISIFGLGAIFFSKNNRLNFVGTGFKKITYWAKN